ncbi:unnamed protein product [Chrysoparadoxa australica]
MGPGEGDSCVKLWGREGEEIVMSQRFHPPPQTASIISGWMDRGVVGPYQPRGPGVLKEAAEN